MSEQRTPSPTLVPEWDQADRMRKALRVSDIGVQELADYLDVSRNTVSTWINGRIQPSTQTLRLVALRCGVPYEWLRDGTEPETSPDGGDGVTAPHVTSGNDVLNAKRTAHVIALNTRRSELPVAV